MAKLKFYYGCMNAGKSVNAIKTYQMYKYKNMNPIIIKPVIDTRDGNQKGWGYTTSRLIKEKIPAYYIENFENELNNINYDKIIIIDEAQFFTRDDVIFISKLIEQQNINIIAYGLKNDINGNLFEGTKAFIEFADEIQEIEMLCEEPDCTNKATHHLRYVNGKPDTSNKVIGIERNNISYKSVCRKHWLQIKEF